LACLSKSIAEVGRLQTREKKICGREIRPAMRKKDYAEQQDIWDLQKIRFARATLDYHSSEWPTIVAVIAHRIPVSDAACSRPATDASLCVRSFVQACLHNSKL
jgi:hypothetical protein